MFSRFERTVLTENNASCQLLLPPVYSIHARRLVIPTGTPLEAEAAARFIGSMVISDFRESGRRGHSRAYGERNQRICRAQRA